MTWTQADLDALSDVTPGWGVIEETRDGKTVRYPVMEGGYQGVFYRHETDPVSVVDADGERWMIGRCTPDGPLCKRRRL